MMKSYFKLCTEFYDIDKPTAPPDALAFYKSFAAAADGPILEPMCGTGRFLIPLLEQGFDVDGTDASPQMLGACRAKCLARGLKPQIEQQFLHQSSMPRRYALVVIPAGSFGLMERPEAREALARLYAQLLPGGKLVFEAHARRPSEPWSGTWGGRWVTRPDGAKIIISWLGNYDPAAAVNRSIHRYELVKDGRLIETEFEDFGGPVYNREELTAMLTEAGFGDVRYLKIYGMREPDETDEEIVYVCTRP